MTELILCTFAAGFIGTGIGGFIASFFSKSNQKIMSLLLAFAAGIMLSVVCFDLLPAAHANSGIVVAATATVLGAIIIYFLNYFIDYLSLKRRKINIDVKRKKRVATEFGQSRAALLQAGILMILAIALHNFPEGLSIGSSYSYQPEIGLVLTLVIALHNIPEGMAIVVPLIAGGMKRFRAVLLTAVSGLPTLLGALLGFWLGGISNLSLAISLGFASGAMLYIVFGEIIPPAILMGRSRLVTAFLILGFLLGFLLTNAL